LCSIPPCHALVVVVVVVVVVVASGRELFQVANNTNLLVRYGLVWVSYFSKTGLIFKIETSKSLYSLISVSVVFWVSFRSHIGLVWVSLWSSNRSYLVSFGYHLGLA
jgi:hypothetical protein